MTDADLIAAERRLAELAEWVEAGRRDPGGLEVLWHSMETATMGGGPDECPFGAEAPEARERWLWALGVALKGRRQRRRDELECANHRRRHGPPSPLARARLASETGPPAPAPLLNGDPPPNVRLPYRDD